MGELTKRHRQVMLVGDLRQVLNDLTDVLGESLTIKMSDTALKQFKQLEKEYDDFYKLDL